jgi:hypothetical protein
VCVAAIYYMMNLQMARRKQKVDNTILIGNLISNKSNVLQWHNVLFDQQFQSFEEWDKKYRLDPEAYSNFQSTMGMLSQVGMCVKEDLVDRDMLFKRGYVVWVKAIYPKIKPIIMGYRALYNDPLYHYWSEYLYTEMMRLYPDIAAPKDRFTSQ